MITQPIGLTRPDLAPAANRVDPKNRGARIRSLRTLKHRLAARAGGSGFCSEMLVPVSWRSFAGSSAHTSRRVWTSIGRFRVFKRQFSGTALGPILGRIQVSIRRGSSLEQAMAREPQAFGTMFLSMIKVAETRGGVPETLKMLAQHYESRQRLLRQARSAMIYPVIVITVAFTVVMLISIFLLPLFASMLKDISRNQQLPLPSEILMSFSGFVRWIGWWLMPLGAVATPFLLVTLYKTPAGKAMIDRIVLATPVFGTLCRKLDTSRFARTLSVLLDAGVDVGNSIDLTADVLRMTPIRNAVRSAREKIIEGKELSGVLDRTRQFSPDVIAVLETGEETGKLPESLAHLADDYDEQISTMVANLGHLVQPLVIFLLGLMVLFIILAVLMPIIQMISSLAAPG